MVNGTFVPYNSSNNSRPLGIFKRTTRPHPGFFYVELVCNIWYDKKTSLQNTLLRFAFELSVRFIVCPNKLRFIRGPINIVDFVATLSFYLDWLLEWIYRDRGDPHSRDSIEFLSIIRIMRLLKLTHHSSGLKILIQVRWKSV